MAFSERLPRNSESRALGVAFRLLKKHKPDLKWVVSFSDASQCGDGTIYRASGFKLTGIKKNSTILEFPDGLRETKLVLSDVLRPRRLELARRYGVTLPGGAATVKPFFDIGARYVPGYQFRYVRFLDPTWEERLAVRVIPFADIPDECRMYRGIRGGSQEPRGNQPRGGGASPTPPLHPTSEP
jgi:hypothetical protein